MKGLYALKPWYAARLGGLRRALVARRVSPNVLTWAGVAFGGAAGAAIALLPTGPVAGAAVAVLLAARLACANLDGGVARESGRMTRSGAVANELGDRLAEFAVLAGCLAVAPTHWVLGAALAATLPSWAALAGAAAGTPRPQGGPVGKTERCLLLVVLAAVPGFAVPVLGVVAAGSLLTAALRLRRVLRSTAAPAQRPGRQLRSGATGATGATGVTSAPGVAEVRGVSRVPAPTGAAAPSTGTAAEYTGPARAPRGRRSRAAADGGGSTLVRAAAHGRDGAA